MPIHQVFRTCTILSASMKLKLDSKLIEDLTLGKNLGLIFWLHQGFSIIFIVIFFDAGTAVFDQ